jgi:hemerythrin-like domain-containing protein
MFDATNSKYQATAEFKPDKTSTWAFPPQNDGWVHAHNALRGELSDIKDVIESIEKRARPLHGWEVIALKKVLSAHFEHIHSHHSNEDDLFVPELRKRINFPEKLVEDHVGLVKKLEELENIMRSLQAGDRLENSDLLQEWIIYQEMMLPHLKEEEDIGLPLMRAYYTQKDITPLIHKLVANSPKIESGSFVYYMGPDRLRNEFMKQEGIPRFVWYIDFKVKYNYFLKEFVENANALKSGIEPVSPKPWYRFLF